MNTCSLEPEFAKYAESDDTYYSFGRHGIIWTVLHILLGGIADPFVYYYIAGDIEQNA